MKQVIKRNGSKVDFDKEKIVNAIEKAFLEVDGEITDKAHQKALEIANFVSEIDATLSVEEIQDIVEDKLMASNRKDIARAYVRYRYKKEMIRNTDNNLMEEISEKIMASNVQNQNANVDEHSFGGRMGEARNSVMKKYALDYIISDMAKQNHLNNEIYIHDLDSYAVGMHNCCARETKFCTKDKGVRSFEDYNNGDEIEVLSHDGSFNKAKIKSFGIQKLNKITFSLAGQAFTTERFTANHRWILNDGTETTQLKAGDKLYRAPINIRVFDWDSATEKEKYYWCLGFVLADGTEAYRWSHGKKNEDVKFVRMRLCGHKTNYEPRFSMLSHSTKEMLNGDLYLTFSSTIGFRKEFPDLDTMTRNEKLALFDGLYCADGQQSGSRKSILTTNEQIASFIEDEAPSLGYFILNIKDKTGEVTNYATRGFTKEYTFIGDTNKYYWTVVNIEQDNEEEVWCLEVENTHSFVLPNGITTGNCLSIPFDELLKNGFNTRQADVRPANSINTAMQLVAVIFQLQSLQQFGGVSATHLDWTMVPYVRKSFYKHYKDGIKYIYGVELDSIEHPEDVSIEDQLYKKFDKAYNYALDMTLKETQQAVEGMYHNLNTLQSRSGNQLPFTSINYGTCTLPEGRMVIKALLEGSLNGVGKLHKTPIFPCGIFQCMKGVNRAPEDPNYDLFRLALKSTAKRLYPNYANVDWSVNEGYDRNDPRTYVATMGCRTYNGLDINAEPGTNPQMKDGRGNICPVTIIMPTLAMEIIEESKTAECKIGDTYSIIENFMRLLDEKIHEAKDMLIERYRYICSQNPDSAKFMYENGLMLGYDGKNIESAMKHGTLALGQIGLAETLQILIGKNHMTEEGMELAKRIEKLFNTRCKEFKNEYKLNIGVYYTPAENLAYTAMKKFKDKYGVIENVSDRDYFTNSTHVPVWEKVDPFTKIDIESQLTGYSNAGCITYIELDSGAKNNIDALETIVNYAMDKDVPYFAINVPNDTCLECGYCDEFNDACPECGSEHIQQLRRVTG